MKPHLQNWKLNITPPSSIGGVTTHKPMVIEPIGISLARCGGSTPEDVEAMRLAAAAPDLLEALEEMLQADDAICNNVGRKSDQAMQRIAAIDSANAAIKKALTP